MRMPVRPATPGRVAIQRPLSWPLRFALGACFGLWALQTWRYAFLCDDAFISFRYARNLAEGAGLVFNPGFERVEGYSNFLWVLVLASGQALGLAPERLANPLLALCGAAVMGLVLRQCRELRPAAASPLWLAFPLAALALNRSFAVWSSSGLETKFFELLVVAGVLSAASEARGAAQGRSERPRSALCFAAAALARPDGLLIAGCALAAAAALDGWRGCFAARRWLRSAALFALPVAGQLLFRWLYYGDVVPNTYHAKIGGRTWWSEGGRYLAGFALEYAAPLWLPLLAAGALALARAGRAELPLLCAAAVLPHALYLAAIGGDHFEYRPLGLSLPLGALLAFCGACHLADRSRRRALATLAGVAALLVASNLLPELSRRDFPSDYRTGFPGETARDDYRAELIDTRAHAWLDALPGLRGYVGALNALAAGSTRHFVGVRQEEHRGFRASVEREARWLEEGIAAGWIPRDAFLAIDSVGVIPYRTRLRTLDRLGLTDRRVAQETEPGTRRSMGHELQASLAHRRERAVDLDSADAVYPILPAGHPKLLWFGHLAREQGQPWVFARLPGARFLVVADLAGGDALARRFPRLAFEPAARLVELELEGGTCRRAVPRAEQLGGPYDHAWVEQSKALFGRGLRAAARIHNRCALRQRPSNPVARLREDLVPW